MNTKLISIFDAKLFGMFNGVSIQAFNKAFKNEQDCTKYLFDLKWKDGYCCHKCGFEKSNKGRTQFHLRCKKCGYDESVTAHTIFHKLKIPLLKAFGLAFRLSVKKKGMSTTELAREFSINQKSSWLFKRKTQEAMKSSGKHPLDGKVEIDELLIEVPEKGKRGRNKTEKKLVVIAIEKVKGNKIGRGYAEVIEQASESCFNPFFEKHIEHGNPKVLSYRPREYEPFEREFEIRQRPSIEGKSFPGLQIVIINLKGWLKGIHHHCSGRFINGYLDEFFFRFNRRNSMNGIWHTLILKFMTNSPYRYIANAA